MSREQSTVDIQRSLEGYFHFSTFRPGQEEVIESIINANDTLALMPTGAGKSLCYQLPAMVSEGITIVVSPLIALMKDQVDSLTARGISATYLNSTLERSELANRLHAVQNGQYKLVYIAPERFESESFSSIYPQLPVRLFAIDEAHCISQWGHDFRPDYSKIKTYLDAFSQRPTVAAFTATATSEVKDDIISQLDLKTPNVFVRGFDRPNLRFFTRYGLSQKKRLSEVYRLIKNIEGSGIVYTLTIKQANETAEFLAKKNVSAVAYHSRIDPDKRSVIQEAFMDNQFTVIVATVAFGMGVDKADIRFVIHQGMPPNLERYYQEAGRAGRDGEIGYCILLHNSQDTSTHHFFIQRSRQEMYRQKKPRDVIQRITTVKYERLETMKQYVQARQCKRALLLKYFGDPAVSKMHGSCHGCDVCLGHIWPEDTQTAAYDDASVAVSADVEQVGCSKTVQYSIDLFRQNYSPQQIAAIRHLSLNTVYGHLISWYLLGGAFPIDKYLDAETERCVLHAIAQVDDYQRLSQIKAHLPDSITYTQIRMVVAKLKRIKID